MISTATISTFKQNLSFIVSMAVLALSIAGLWIIVLMDTPSDKRVRAACDHYAAILLGSDSLLEVTRAGLLVDQLNCSMRRRVP